MMKSLLLAAALVNVVFAQGPGFPAGPVGPVGPAAGPCTLTTLKAFGPSNLDFSQSSHTGAVFIVNKGGVSSGTTVGPFNTCLSGYRRMGAHDWAATCNNGAWINPVIEPSDSPFPFTCKPEACVNKPFCTQTITNPSISPDKCSANVAMSSWGAHHGTDLWKINEAGGSTNYAWYSESPPTSGTNWFQMNVPGDPQPILGVVTQGRGGSPSFAAHTVSAFKVQTSMDGQTWQYVNGGAEFTGNMNTASGGDLGFIGVWNKFPEPVLALAVRIIPMCDSSNPSDRLHYCLHQMLRAGLILNNQDPECNICEPPMMRFDVDAGQCVCGAGLGGEPRWDRDTNSWDTTPCYSLLRDPAAVRGPSRAGIVQAEFDINDNPVTSVVDSQFNSVIAALDNGKFVSAWLSTEADFTPGTTTGVYARIRNADGSHAVGGGDIVVHVTGDGNNHNTPSVTALPDGAFAIAHRDQTNMKFRAQIFDKIGLTSSQVTLNPNAASHSSLAQLASTKSTGRWAAAYTTSPPNKLTVQVFANPFLTQGPLLLDLCSGTEVEFDKHWIYAHDDDETRFLAVWLADNSPTSQVCTHLIGTNGVKLGSPTPIDLGAGFDPSISALRLVSTGLDSDGNPTYSVVWTLKNEALRQKTLTINAASNTIEFDKGVPSGYTNFKGAECGGTVVATSVLGEAPVTNLANCAARCDSKAACDAFVWDAANTACHLSGDATGETMAESPGLTCFLDETLVDLSNSAALGGAMYAAPFAQLSASRTPTGGVALFWNAGPASPSTGIVLLGRYFTSSLVPVGEVFRVNTVQSSVGFSNIDSVLLRDEGRIMVQFFRESLTTANDGQIMGSLLTTPCSPPTLPFTNSTTETCSSVSGSNAWNTAASFTFTRQCDYDTGAWVDDRMDSALQACLLEPVSCETSTRHMDRFCALRHQYNRDN